MRTDEMHTGFGDTGLAEHLLILTQWLSPSYPVGAFSYSHGLEWAVQEGQVTDAPTFQSWLVSVLEHGAGRNDAILLAHAWRAQDPAALAEIDALSRALAPSSERLQETVLQGAAFADTTARIWGLDLTPLTYPVAIGAAARALDIPLGPTARLFLQAFASSLASAAIRLVPLGQTEGQTCVANIAPVCTRIGDLALGQSLDDLGNSAFLVDIASMKHETQYSRLFRS